MQERWVDIELYYCRTKLRPWGIKKTAFVMARGPVQAAFLWAETGLGTHGEIEVFSYKRRGEGVIHDLDDSKYRLGSFPADLTTLLQLASEERRA
jgi:hypothetical protein